MRSLEYNLAGQSISEMQAGWGGQDVTWHVPRSNKKVSDERYWGYHCTALSRPLGNPDENIQPGFSSQLIGTSGLGGLWGQGFFDFLLSVITVFCLSLLWELGIRLLCWDFSHFDTYFSASNIIVTPSHVLQCWHLAPHFRSSSQTSWLSMWWKEFNNFHPGGVISNYYLMWPHHHCKEGRAGSQIVSEMDCLSKQHSLLSSKIWPENTIFGFKNHRTKLRWPRPAQLKLVSIRGCQLGEALTFTKL